MKASIIIPAYNEEERIASVITAALAQDYPDFEVIVVDNASIDRTAEIARTFPGVRVVFEPKKGTSAARECGRVHATGQIIANVDADCVPESDWLSKGIKYFKNPRIVGASGPYNYYDAGFFLRIFLWSGFFLRWMFNRLAQSRRVRFGGTLVGGNTLMRASALARAGGYDTNVVFYGDEASVAKRIAPYGRTVFTLGLTMETSARRFKREGVFQLSYHYLTNMFGERKTAKSVPSISLIVCAYNEEKYIGACLKSIMPHRELLREIIVVDNASTDSTPEIAARFPGVRVVSEPSKGLTKARKKGLVEATSDILIYLDADMELSEDWISRALTHYQNNQSLVCVSGIYVYKDVPFLTRAGVWFYWHVFAYLTYLCTGYMVIGGNFAVRRSAILEIGGFDQTIEFYGEDTDIARRLHVVGKAKLATSMRITTSPRRLDAEGPFKIAYLYVKNFLSVAWRGKPATSQYNDYR